MKTLTKEQVFKYMTDNVRAGKSPVDGLQILSGGIGWSNGWMELPESATVGSIGSGKYKFCLAPRTRNICGFDVPAPETEAPEDGNKYYVLDTFEDSGVYRASWVNDHSDQFALRNGLWLSEADAIANAKALRGENPYE